ncbi:MAG TPA: Ig-like domain-containing protein [Terracidiphilus sp.]|nr:Ig-like domain-containing protein [Terracidiphilus sp.]
MKNFRRKAPFWAATLASLWMAACGGGGGGGNNNPPPTKTTPTVTVTPGSQSISTIQSLAVTVAVSGSNGTPTGSVTLSSGSYTSAATALTSGSASITVPAGSLSAPTATLSATYTPDSASSSNYNSASGSSGAVTITKVTPTVTVTPGSGSISTTQSLAVTIAVSGGSGAPTVTGSVTLSSGTYTSSATVLSSGSVTITIPAGSLAAGSDSLTAAYTPDSAGEGIYDSASGTAASQVTVTKATPNVTVKPASQSITAAQTLPVTITVSGGTGAPTATGSVVLSNGGYSSGSLTLSNGGSASLIVPANTLAAGDDTLTADYTPDTSSSNVYTSAQGKASVNVASGPMITSFSAGTNPLVAGNNTTMTAVFSGGSGAITPGSISVSSGTPVTVNPTQTTTYTLTVTPTSGTAVTQTLTLTVYPSVTVCITPSCSGPAISNQLLGMNLASWYDVISNRAAIVNAFSGAGIKAVRWPGGSWSDGYHWNGSASYPTIGPPTGCTDVTVGNGTTASVYPNGNDTFLNFVDDIVDVGSFDLAVTANYGSNTQCNGPGDPSEAANWAAYATKLGTSIHYMTIGNEEYGSWEVDMHTGTSQNNPTVYACEITGCTNLPSGLSTGLPSGAPGFYSAIKTAVQNAGGTANTTLVGVEVNANATCCAANAANWDTTVLSNAKGAYDFVEFHYYPQNPLNESDTFVVQNAAADFTNNIKTIQSELTTAGAPNTPIYVGEIGTVSSNPGKQSWSITQGLYAGQILGEAMNDGVARLTWWIGFGNCNGNQGNLSSSLYGWQNFGAYNIFADGAGDAAYPNGSPCNYGGPIGTMSPTAEAFNLFQNVAVTGEFPQVTSVVDGTGYTRAYAATHGSGYALVLFNLNKTTAETVSVTIQGQNTSTGGVTLTTYDKAIYDQSDPTCATDVALGCSYNSSLMYPAWPGPSMTTMPGPVLLPLTITLQPWSMNVVMVKP